jgi:hypothetical protein
VTDPVDSTVITIEKAGGSFGIISIVVTEGTEQLVGSFLIPANGVAMDLSGDDGRSFDLVDASGTSLITFFPELFLSRVSNDVVIIEDWDLDASGSLLATAGDFDEITLSVILNGSFVTGGDTITFEITNLSGDPDAPLYQLDTMVTGTLTPVEFPDPSTAVSFDFTTGTDGFSPTDPDLTTLFTGLSVSGSFAYANWPPPVAVSPGPAAPGSVIYPGAFLEVTGTVNGSNFADSLGFALIGNDRFESTGFTDFMLFGSGMTLDAGFEIGGYTLIGVRWIHIEGSTTPDDFLLTDLLPPSLPLVTGRFALDFELTADPQVTASVFFEDLTITPNP